MDQPRSDSAVASQPPTTAYRPVRVGHGADTVINPERRGVSLPLPEGPGLPTSSVWLRLFPSEVDYQDPAQVPAPAGLKLGHFEIQARIGAGGMGAVFHAMDTRLQRAVALKILSPSLSRDDAAVQRFRNEARAAARLDHENIARVYFIGEELGLHFIAFEFISGTNLRELIRERSRIDTTEAVNFVLQIASALRHTS
ncbi:MAG: protein kinase, partial [Planctomycetaceae bacterium]|nr:protein kinase [Planctomycetaceae bacterium]